jgi:hypothetical protein
MKDRENAFENKFAHDVEMQFVAEARQNSRWSSFGPQTDGQICTRDGLR